MVRIFLVVELFVDVVFAFALRARILEKVADAPSKILSARNPIPTLFAISFAESPRMIPIVVRAAAPPALLIAYFPTALVTLLATFSEPSPTADATQPSTNELPIVFSETSCPVSRRMPVSTTALTIPPTTTFPTHAKSEPKKCPVGSM